ncbi:hypothetical protein [Halosolutus halophilus]|uniref:hypothetical protein n=1 Tax=Halosolutus halophilus TaxID=1552990 RepID=UPI002234FC4C|nr:hypothetical protein [Halosolutus halophilus]
MHDGHEDERDSSQLSRRAVLQATNGAVALSAVGSARAGRGGGEAEAQRARLDRRCPEATIEPSHGSCAGASVEGCDDDHPVTVELREAVAETLSERYPDVGSLLDDEYKPYFDTIGGGSGYSHWLSPGYIGDGTILDPDRPESVLVDDESWRPIGIMFIATSDGDPISPPPVIYDAAADVTYEDEVAPAVPESDAGEDRDGSEDRCSPWHYHAGLPSRFAWWYYRQVYEGDYEDGDVRLPCRTPCMLHVWVVDHPESVYAHDAPPVEYRDREPADEPGFETDADPGEDALGWDVLPDEVTPDRLPDEFSVLGP